MTAVLFALAAGAGAALRHGVNRLGRGWAGTLAVNVIGSFLLGLLVGSDPSPSVRTVIGTALLGSFTTFSTFALDVAEARPTRRIAIAGGSLVLTVGAAGVGYGLA
ncbi:MAG: CrcB family protein [Ilumatobacteraceae bacterium]